MLIEQTFKQELTKRKFKPCKHQFRFITIGINHHSIEKDTANNQTTNFQDFHCAGYLTLCEPILYSIPFDLTVNVVRTNRMLLEVNSFR